MDGDRGRFFFVLELWSFRLYLGASHCTYVFWLMLYSFFFFRDVYDRGDIMFMFLFLFPVSYCAILITDLYL